MVSEMCPKIGSVQDADLGSIRMPSRLLELLENYCDQTQRTKSDVTRAALSAWLHADMQTIMQICEMEQAEDNGHNGEKK